MKNIILIFSFLLSFNTFANSPAKIDFVKGEALVNGKLVKKLPYQVNIGDLLEARVKTSSKSKASFVRVVFNNGDKIGISKGKVVIKALDKKMTNFKVITGKFFNYVKPSLSRKVQVQAKNISLGVRGTKYMLEESSDKSYLCVCEGEVLASKGKSSVSVKAGYDLDAFKGRELEGTREASAAMLKMVTGSFDLLGEPVKSIK